MEDHKKDFLKLFNEKRGVKQPKDIERWYDEVYKAKEDLRVFLGGDSKEIELSLTYDDRVAKKSPLIAEFSEWIKDNFNHYHDKFIVPLNKDIENKDIDGTKFSKHILIEAKKNEMNDYNLGILKKYLSRLGDFWQENSPKQMAIISIEPWQFIIFAHDIFGGSCWDHFKSSYTEQPKFKFLLALFKTSATLRVYDNNKSMLARMMLYILEDRRSIWIHNYRSTKISGDPTDMIKVIYNKIIGETELDKIIFGQQYFLGQSSFYAEQLTSVYDKSLGGIQIEDHKEFAGFKIPKWLEFV